MRKKFLLFTFCAVALFFYALLASAGNYRVDYGSTEIKVTMSGDFTLDELKAAGRSAAKEIAQKAGSQGYVQDGPVTYQMGDGIYVIQPDGSERVMNAIKIYRVKQRPKPQPQQPPGPSGPGNRPPPSGQQQPSSGGQQPSAW